MLGPASVVPSKLPEFLSSLLGTDVKEMDPYVEETSGVICVSCQYWPKTGNGTSARPPMNGWVKPMPDGRGKPREEEEPTYLQRQKKTGENQRAVC